MKSMFSSPEEVKKYKYWAAPMVGYSDLAFRLQCRKRGAHVTSTPMIYADGYCQRPEYREQFPLDLTGADRPLVMQFCGKEPEHFANVARFIEREKLPVDAIEINLGCPQRCAKNPGFGAFLMDPEPELRARLGAIIRAMQEATEHLAVFAKIRVFDSYETTRDYVLFLQENGVDCLTVHARTRAEKRDANVRARWNFIKQLRADPEIRVPIIANGDIRCLDDVKRCMAETGADGVMSATSLLHNPALFSEGERPPALELALEYLELARRSQVTWMQISRHLNQLLSRRARRRCPATVAAIQDMSRDRHPADFDKFVAILKQEMTDYMKWLEEVNAAAKDQVHQQQRQYQLQQQQGTDNDNDNDNDDDNDIMAEEREMGILEEEICPYYLDNQCRMGGDEIKGCSHGLHDRSLISKQNEKKQKEKKEEEWTIVA